jgi:hypothetical protein
MLKEMLCSYSKVPYALSTFAVEMWILRYSFMSNVKQENKCYGFLQVYSPDGMTEVGRITKQWSGFAREAFTDADLFGVSFPMDLDVKIKAVMLGACFLIVSTEEFLDWSVKYIYILILFTHFRIICTLKTPKIRIRSIGCVKNFVLVSAPLVNRNICCAKKAI